MITLNSTFFVQIINFLILVALLRAFCYKPVVRMIHARQDKIAESLQKADDDAAEADKLLADYKAKLAAAQQKAEEIVANAEKRAASEREESVKRTREEIAQMKKAAEAEINRDRERAVEQLRAQMVALSMAAASKIIEKNMDAADNEQIINEFVSKLDRDKIGDLSC